VGDHLAAATSNVLGTTPPYFERAVHYSGLTDEQAATLAKQFHAGQMELLQELNAKASEMKANNDDPATARFRAGGYVFTQTEQDR
jgi:pyrroline-5-carboxylate reductase